MPAPALRLFYDLSEGSKLHSGFDLDRSIFFVERYQLNIVFALLIFFNISITVQIEDSDIAIFQLILLMNPYDLFIRINRFHAVAGNADAEVCSCRDIITDFKFLIRIRVKKEAGTGRSGFCKYFKRSACDVDRFFPDIHSAFDQQIHIFNRFFLAFFIELSEEIFFDSNAEGIINIIYPKNLAEGKELDYIW